MIRHFWPYTMYIDTFSRNLGDRVTKSISSESVFGGKSEFSAEGVQPHTNTLYREELYFININVIKVSSNMFTLSVRNALRTEKNLSTSTEVQGQ